MECPQIDLYEFLTDSELHQYYNVIKNELKITNAAQFKYATDEDLKNVGLSRPEIRRLRKYYEKHFPHGYLSKIKRLLQAPATIVKREDGSSMLYSNSSLNSYGGGSETASTASGAAGGASPNKVPNNKHIIPADAISVNKQLGTGEFGIVQQGVWTNGTERIQVAIKCLCRERMQSNPMEFLKEAAIMHSIEHENIVRLYGVVLATDSLMLVTELAHLRSLLECLKDSGLRVSFLTVPTLCEFATQICNGMSYLENKRLIHRDLAARNILVFSKNKVKISDFGLSRALGVGKDYYKTNFNVNLKLPIAWCAPECINYLRFTNASDVWAFGVCLWEMFSYGFQPWAALTGLQILEAIDAPNYQRLEQPDCCPTEYYTLMMKCWQDDPLKRPKFSEIAELLPEMKPEQLKAVVNCLETKNDQLSYRQGDIITVLDRNTGTPFWKGVLNTGKTGYFNPSNTVAYLEGLPSANRESFCRTNERSSKRKLRTEMISKPQNDLKHTGHVGIDGDSFGDIAFLGNSQSYNHVPRQIVTPYKPSEDIEQTPLLLPPTPTSPDSMQSCYFNEGNQASGTSVNPSFISSTENTPKQTSSFQFPHYNVSSNNPFAQRSTEELHNSSGLFALQNKNYGLDRKCFTNNSISLLGEMENESNEMNWRNAGGNREEPHEYHEISDDEMTAEKLDLGPSLLEEINSMFGSMSASNTGSNYQTKPMDFDQINIKNEFAEISNKLGRKNSLGDSSKFTHSKKKSSTGHVKQISVKDEKILNQAIEIANEISARSMIDLVTDQPPQTQSPKRKFSFRFPHLTKDGNKTDSLNNHANNSHAAEHNGSTVANASPHTKKKNFSEELKSIPDLQEIIGEGAKEAYNSLIERNSSFHESPVANLLRNLDTNEFDLSNSRTLPRLSMQTDATAPVDNIQLSNTTTQATRPMTLPTRGAANRLRQQFSLQNNRCNSNTTTPLQEDAPHIDGACESPSYLNNTGYNFPEKNLVVDNKLMTDNTDSNPIPLPPREGKKHIKTNAKRHVRKYPLIIPANGVQRTLNKVTGSEGEDTGISQCNAMRRQNQQNNINLNHNNKENVMVKRAVETLPKLQLGISQNSVAAYENTTALLEHNQTLSKARVLKVNSIDEEQHTYQNLEDETDGSKSYTPDTASLQFENILEADFNKGQVLSSPDVTDGFYNFSIQKEQYNKCKIGDLAGGKMSGLYVNEDELRNLDIDKSTTKFQPLKPASSAAASPTKEKRSGSGAENPFHTKEASVELGNNQESEVTNESELAGNALFKKVRVSCDLAMNNKDSSKSNSSETLAVSKPVIVRKASTESECLAASVARLTDSNSVSCEDLLEFSDKKPKGCERGVDSDEVRIMVKVLGKDSTPERCLKVLEVIKWDVHKGIKIMKLQNILNKAELSTEQCVEALQEYEWDLYRTALQLRNLRN